MSIPNIFHVFQDIHADAGKITAERLNTNWSRLYDMFDPAKVGISEDNIKTISKILVANRNYTGVNKITGSFEFNVCPIIPDASLSEAKINIVNLVKKVSGKIPDIDIDTNIPRKNIDETISGSWTFNQAIKNFLAEHKEALPDTVVNGQIIEFSGDLYVGKNGIWEKIHYVSSPVSELGSIVSNNTRITGGGILVTHTVGYIKLKQYTANEATGPIRVIYGGESGIGGPYLNLQLKKNGVEVSTLTIAPDSTDSKSYDFTSLAQNDTIELWGFISQGTIAEVNKFDICYDHAIKKIDGHTLITPITIAFESGLAYSFTTS